MLLKLSDVGPEGLDAGLNPGDPGQVLWPELISIDHEVEERGNALVGASEDLADFASQVVTCGGAGDVCQSQQTKPLAEQVEGAFAHDQ